MKHFEWRFVIRENTDNRVISLLEVKDGNARFWGIIREFDDGYSPALFNKDRSNYITIFERLTIFDAKQEIEKKLMDDEIIMDGDELVDYTE